MSTWKITWQVERAYGLIQFYTQMQRIQHCCKTSVRSSEAYYYYYTYTTLQTVPVKQSCPMNFLGSGLLKSFLKKTIETVVWKISFGHIKLNSWAYGVMALIPNLEHAIYTYTYTYIYHIIKDLLNPRMKTNTFL